MLSGSSFVAVEYSRPVAVPDEPVSSVRRLDLQPASSPLPSVVAVLPMPSSLPPPPTYSAQMGMIVSRSVYGKVPKRKLLSTLIAASGNDYNTGNWIKSLKLSSMGKAIRLKRGS